MRAIDIPAIAVFRVWARCPRHSYEFRHSMVVLRG